MKPTLQQIEDTSNLIKAARLLGASYQCLRSIPSIKLPDKRVVAIDDFEHYFRFTHGKHRSLVLEKPVTPEAIKTHIIKFLAPLPKRKPKK